MSEPPGDSAMSAAGARDVVIVGGGHNALVAATLLARRGQSVLVLERSPAVGGAAVSAQPFPGVEATVSRYAYLVSLFPRSLMADLGVSVELRRRRISSCTPDGATALLIAGSQGLSQSPAATRRSFERAVGVAGEYSSWLSWHRLTQQMAAALAPTLLQPLMSEHRARALLGPEVWTALVQQPLGVSLDQVFESDLVKGLVLTDGLIGTFASSRDDSLRQNRCLLYHVIGNGEGSWDVPVGGMGAISDALATAARTAGVEIHTSAEVERIDADAKSAEVRTTSGERYRARLVLCGAAPTVLDALLGRNATSSSPEGAQVKLNMIVGRLPRLACNVDPRDAFAGTLHVNERRSELDVAFARAAAGALPDPIPCEAYCHSLSDASILGPQLRERGAHSLTVFALQTPARLFCDSPAGAGLGAERAASAVLASLQSVLAEPLEDCLLTGRDGRPCIEVHTPADLERDLNMPGGHIFHGELQWPWAESDGEVGRWGVETDLPNVLLCGSGARRGGAVSGIAGHNAAMAALDHLTGRPGGHASPHPGRATAR